MNGGGIPPAPSPQPRKSPPAPPPLHQVDRSRLLPLAKGFVDGILRLLPTDQLPPTLSRQILLAAARAMVTAIPLPPLPETPVPAASRLLALLTGNEDVSEPEAGAFGSQIIPAALELVRGFATALPDAWQDLFDTPEQVGAAASILGISVPSGAVGGLPPGGAGSAPPQDAEAGSPRTMAAAHSELLTLFPKQAHLLIPPIWLRYDAIAWEVQLGAASLRLSGLLIPSTSSVGVAIHQALQASYVQRLHVRGIPPRELIVEDTVWRPGLEARPLSNYRSGGPVRFQAAHTSFRSVKDGNRRPDALDLTTPELWEIKPVLTASDAVAQLYRYSDGYRCAFEQIVERGVVPLPADPAALALGVAGRGAFPAWESVRATRGLAVTFTLDGLPGVLLYTIVNYKRAWEAAQQVARDLKEWAKKIQDALRRLKKKFDDWTPPSLPEPIPAWLCIALLILVAAYLIYVCAVIGAAGGTVAGPGPGTVLGGVLGTAAAMVIIGVVVKHMLDGQEKDTRDKLAAAGIEERPAESGQARPPRSTPPPPPLVTMRTAFGACTLPPSAATQLIWLQAASGTLLMRAGARAMTDEVTAIANALMSQTATA